MNIENFCEEYGRGGGRAGGSVGRGGGGTRRIGGIRPSAPISANKSSQVSSKMFPKYKQSCLLLLPR
jgi:hypothetical protein